MYAIGPIVDAIVVPPMSSPRTRLGVRNEGVRRSARRTPGSRWSLRTIERAITESWLSFVLRMRNDPR
jgi:hypothetical protein